jgi:transcriptional regulator with XRE-family HTH domain
MRLKRNWSQQQLADASGLSSRTVQRIEAGQPASVETLKCLAAVFEVDIATLKPESPMENVSKATELEEQQAFREVTNLRKFYIHLLQYVVINACLNAINFGFDPDPMWAPFVALFWGMGLLVHALTVFKLNRVLGPQWEKRQVEKRLGRPL